MRVETSRKTGRDTDYGGMMMSKQDWDQSHRRYQLVNELAARPELLVEPLAPQVVAEFGNREHALRALHQRWVTLVNGCLDVEFETGDADNPAISLQRAVRRAMAHSPALAETLGIFRHDPLIAGLDEHFHLRLAEAVGINRPGATVREVVHEIRGLLASAVAAEKLLPTQRRSWRPRNPLRWGRRAEAIELV